MNACKHIQILLWIPHMEHRENQLLDILIFKFNFHKFRYFQQRINAVIHFWYFACKQRLQGLSVREHKVKQASKQNTLQYNTFVGIPVVVQEWSVHLHRCPSSKTNHPPLVALLSKSISWQWHDPFHGPGSFQILGIKLYAPHVLQMEINSLSGNNFTVSPVSVLRNKLSWKSFLHSMVLPDIMVNVMETSKQWEGEWKGWIE